MTGNRRLLFRMLMITFAIVTFCLLPATSAHCDIKLPAKVPLWSQAHPDWATETLGNSSYTMQKSGCGVTSVAMVFAYYRIPTDPLKTLNALKNIDGAFDGEGGLIFEMACMLPGASTRHISYVYPMPMDYDRIDQELTAGYPVIVRVRKPSGSLHFVVVTGKVGNSYSINDPGETSNTTLDTFPEEDRLHFRVFRGDVPQPFYRVLPWSWGAGDPNLIAADLNGLLSILGNREGVSLGGNNESNASILGHRIPLSKAIANASAAIRGDQKSRVELSILGVKIYEKSSSTPQQSNLPQVNPTINASLLTDKIEKGFDVSQPAFFMIGPIPVSVTAGVRGAAGLEFSLDVSGLSASGSIRPYLRSSGYAEAAVDLWLAAAGAGAELTFIDYSLPVTCEVGLVPNYLVAEPSWGVMWRYNCSSELRMLDGRIYAYAKVRYPCIKDWWFAWCEHRWDFDIFRWDGLRYNSTLFSGQGWLSQYEPVPTLLGVAPNSVLMDQPVTITIDGSGFQGMGVIDGMHVCWNGQPLTTTAISSSKLQAVVPAEYLASRGTANVTISGAYGSSNSLPVKVELPPPVISRITPGSATATGGRFILTVKGKYLINGSTIYFNGSPLIPTQHISDTELTAWVEADKISTAGIATITVEQPEPYKFQPTTISYAIHPPDPVLNELNPTWVWDGDAGFILTVKGYGFLQDAAVVYWNGAPLEMTSTAFDILTAKIPDWRVRYEGLNFITVANYDRSGVSGLPSNSLPFKVGPPTFAITDLGVLGSRVDYTEATAINASGHVVGNSRNQGQTNRGWIWRDGSMTDLGSISGENGVNALDINASDEVVGIAGEDTYPHTAFIWRNGSINTLPWGDAYFHGASSINDQGQIVGSSIVSEYYSYKQVSTLWKNGQWKMLPNMGGAPDIALRINNLGQIVGICNDKNDVDHAVLWPGTGVVDLWPGNSSAVPMAINDNGDIALRAASSGHTRAFLLKNSVKTDIGTLGGDSSRPIGMNNSAYIVGSSQTVSGQASEDAFLWAKGKMRNLNELLVAQNGWQLTKAVGINDNNEIAAVGTYDGHVRSCLLKPVVLSSSIPTASVSNAALQPNVVTVSPDVVTVCSARIILTIDGSGFIQGAQVFWNGAALPTAFISATRLQASVSSTLLGSVGTALISVANPGGDVSDGVVFTIVNPRPGLASISPSRTTTGGSGMTIEITGSRFIPGSTATWNGNPLSTQFMSQNRLIATVPAANTENPGLAALDVTTFGPGGGKSRAAAVGIGGPAPVLAGFEPESVEAGGADFSITVNGSGFGPTTVVLWDDEALTTTYVSPTQIRVSVQASRIATAGYPIIALSDTAAGAWKSKAVPFIVRNPKPVLSSLNPTSVQASKPEFTLTVNGAGFTEGATVYWNGSPKTTTYVSANRVTAKISEADLSEPGITNVTVGNPSPDNGRSDPMSLTITDPPVLGRITPGAVKAGGPAIALKLEGSGFVAGSKVLWNGDLLNTSYVSAQELAAVLPASSINTPGLYMVAVADPGGAKSMPVPFTVYDRVMPIPSISSLEPSWVSAGGPAFLLIVTGTGFTSQSSVLWNGVSHPGALLSDTQLAAYIEASEIASAGTVKVQVSNPADGGVGGGLSNPLFISVK